MLLSGLFLNLIFQYNSVECQLLEVESFVNTNDQNHNEQHKIVSGMTTYACNGWSDMPTTIYLTSPNNPIGNITIF